MDSHTAIVGTPAQPWRGTWRNESDTEAFAQRLANCPALRNATLTLHGDLGAGKTTLVRYLLRALGVNGRIKSPTSRSWSRTAHPTSPFGISTSTASATRANGRTRVFVNCLPALGSNWWSGPNKRVMPSRRLTWVCISTPMKRDNAKSKSSHTQARDNP
ncbi:MAG: hypothetical protein RJA56_445 [Pseudomonadota bacterium]